MRPQEPSRRAILKGGVAATLAATAHALNPRKTFAARDHKLVFWLQPNFNATADQSSRSRSGRTPTGRRGGPDRRS